MSITVHDMRCAAFSFADMYRAEERTLIGPMIGFYLNGQVARADQIERILMERFGANWLDDHELKRQAFRALRFIVKIGQSECILFASVAKVYLSSAVFAALPPADKARILTSHEYKDTALFTVRVALVVVIQTKEHVGAYTQNREPEEAPQFRVWPATDCYGIPKLF